MRLRYKNSYVDITDEIFPTWIEDLLKLDALITEDARKELFNNASLSSLLETFKKGKHEYTLSESEWELLSTLIIMRRNTLPSYQNR